MKKILVILGPTSTGKTDLALQIAKKSNGELVACDSRQVYTNLDIGTGKYPNLNIKYQISNIKKKKTYWEIDGIKIHMYDVVDPKKQYTVFNFVKDANRVIDEILKKGKLPIVVGGTGLYLKALLEGLPSLSVPLDFKLREELKKLSLQELQQKLQKLSPDRWEKMNYSDRQNPRRLIRAIELFSMSLRGASGTSDEAIFPVRKVDGSGRFLTAFGMTGGFAKHSFDVLKIGLNAPRKVLYQRIDKRVVDRINQGMIDEAEKLHEKGLSFSRMRQLGLEYGVLADYLENKITDTDKLIKVMQGKIHGFARRQLTWFKKERKVFWFDITDPNWPDQVETKVSSWYHSTHDKKN